MVSANIFPIMKTNTLAAGPLKVNQARGVLTLVPDMQSYPVEAKVKTRDGKTIVIHRNDRFYFLYLDGKLLMSREKRMSAEAVSKLGCAETQHCKAPKVLIDGLGMGFALRAALDSLSQNASVLTVEESTETITWNSSGGCLEELADKPLEDPRSEVIHGNFIDHLKQSAADSWDAIVIDVDSNKPYGGDHTGTDFLYTLEGLKEVRRALAPNGVLAFGFLEVPENLDALFKQAGFIAVKNSADCGQGGHLILMSTINLGA